MDKYIIGPNIISNKSKDEDAILICDLDDEQDFLLKIKDVSIDFYLLIEKGLSKKEIIQNILKNYEGCSENQIERDFDNFIDNLNKHKILE